MAEQVTRFAESERYDAVARVRVLSHREVAIPTDIEWPPMKEPTFSNTPFERTSVEIIETYHGTLSSPYGLVTHCYMLENADLDIGREYVVFVHEYFVGENEYPGEPGRSHYNQAQLDAVGGRGGVFQGRQLWIIDGDTAWRIPVEHIVDAPPGPDLAAAKAGGESLALSKLEAAIAASFE